MPAGVDSNFKEVKGQRSREQIIAAARLRRSRMFVAIVCALEHPLTPDGSHVGRKAKTVLRIDPGGVECDLIVMIPIS